MNEKNRNLTDEDVDRIVDGLWEKATNTFKLNVGSGVLGFVWKTLLLALIGIAVYGAGFRMKLGV